MYFKVSAAKSWGKRAAIPPERNFKRFPSDNVEKYPHVFLAICFDIG